LQAPQTETRAEPTLYLWNAQQQTIFNHVAHGKGHLAVMARAGSGKTTTTLEALRHLPRGKKALLCAFNKSIAQRLSDEAPSNVTVKTLHALGYSAIRKVWGRQVKSDARRDGLLITSVVPQELKRDDREKVKKLVSLAKSYMVDSDQDLEELRDQHNLAINWLAYESREHGYQVPDSFGRIPVYDRHGKPIDPQMRLQLEDARQLRWVRTIMQRSLEQAEEVSFDDMVYVPAMLQMPTGSFDYVFVDETQDMNRPQMVLAMNALAPKGRMIVIGDDRQAIYGFRGADSNAMGSLIKRLDAETLPLTVSQRCPALVAQMAQKYVPDFQARRDAAWGVIQHVNLEAAESRWKEGDFVLSRANAPLAMLCLRAIANGKRAHIQGKDIGAGLKSLIEKSEARNVKEFFEWLADWYRSESERLLSKNKEHLVEALYDRCLTLQYLSVGLQSLNELVERIDHVFSDDLGPRIMFSSVHRAKGLEAERVWVLTQTFQHERTQWPFGTPESRKQEEKNIWYVAITRTRHSLFLVDKFSMEEDEDEG